MLDTVGENNMTNGNYLSRGSQTGYRALDALYRQAGIAGSDTIGKIEYLHGFVGLKDAEKQFVWIQMLRGGYDRALSVIEERVADDISRAATENLEHSERTQLVVASLRSGKPESRQTIERLVTKALVGRPSGAYEPEYRQCA